MWLPALPTWQRIPELLLLPDFPAASPFGAWQVMCSVWFTRVCHPQAAPTGATLSYQGEKCISWKPALPGYLVSQHSGFGLEGGLARSRGRLAQPLLPLCQPEKKEISHDFSFFHTSVHSGVSAFSLHHFRECLPCKTTTHSQRHLVNSGFMLARTSLWSQRGNLYPSFSHIRVRSRATRVTTSLWGGQQGGAAHGGNAGFSLLTEASCWEIFTAETKNTQCCNVSQHQYAPDTQQMRCFEVQMFYCNISLFTVPFPLSLGAKSTPKCKAILGRKAKWW